MPGGEPGIDVVELREETAILEDRLANLLEAGLFRNGRKKGATDGAGGGPAPEVGPGGAGETGGVADRLERKIVTALFRSRRAVERQELARAAALLSWADAQLEKAVYGQRWYWRAFRLHQRHILIYHIAAVIVILNIATGWGPFGAVASSVWGIPVQAFGFGALGGTLRGLYWLQVQINRGVYRVRFDSAHLAAPWVSGLFGGLVFLLLKAGLLTLGGDGGEGVDASMGSYALVFFAGFSWEWIVEQLDRIGSRGTPASTDEAPEGSRGASGARDGTDGEDGEDAVAPGSTVATPVQPPREPDGAAPRHGVPVVPPVAASGDTPGPVVDDPDSGPHPDPDPVASRPLLLISGGVLLGLYLARRGRD